MSPTTTRVALRRAGTLLVAAALVGGPVSVAVADPSGEPTPTASASAPAETPAPSTSAEPTQTASASPSPSAPASGTATPTTSAAAPTTSAPEATEDAGLVPGGRARTFGLAAASGPATSTDTTLVAAGYLQRELVSSGYTLPIEFGGVEYPQWGLVADAVLALDAAGTGQTAATAATQKLAQNVRNYMSYDDGDPSTVDDVYAGATAKLLNVALAQGVDPRAFGGVDLIASLEGLEQPSGRFSDASPWGDYSNAFGQSLALIGLDRAGRTVSSQALAFLVDQQCTDGGFRLDPGTGPCSSDPDATAMAVQALIAVGGASAAVADGLDYLTTQQQSSGGLGGAGPTSATNANTTGLAGQAFLAGGRTAQARSSVSYVEGLQYGCSFPEVLRGGIAYNQAAYDAQETAGSGATPQDQDRRSTSQALLALAGTPIAAVTAVGADAEAPALTCAAPTSSGEPTSTTDPTSTGGASPTTSSGPTSGSDGEETVSPVASGPDALAQTGSDLLWPVGAGLLLVAAGALTVAASRRRGAHA